MKQHRSLIYYLYNNRMIQKDMKQKIIINFINIKIYIEFKYTKIPNYN